jgi:hypothetical protein
MQQQEEYLKEGYYISSKYTNFQDMKIHAKTCYDEFLSRVNDIIFSLNRCFSSREKLDGVKKKNLHKFNFYIPTC